ncbi:MAG: T9SS type A sorting domain-containing protein, partial [Cytophagales bacterium]|nr:T9SS type A sorting domain-containing protein [Cytophagales bacterium]
GGGGSTTNFLETTDGGTSWSNITSTYSYRINKFRVFGDTVYASGIRIHRWARPKVLALSEESIPVNYVSIYPNPFQHHITIRLKEDTWTSATLTIHSLSGEELYNQSIGVESTISLNQLPAGAYFIKIQSGEKFWFQKLVKE